MTNVEMVSDIIDLEEYLKAKNLSASSIYVYLSTVKNFLSDRPDITQIDAYNKFIFEHGIKKRSAYCYDALRIYIKYKFEKDPRMQSLLRNLLKPKLQDVKKSVRYLDDETREQIISLLLNYKHRIIAKIQNATGVRAGDVLRLKKGNISYEVYDERLPVMRIDFEGKGGKHFIKWIFDEKLQTQIDLFIKSNNLDTEYYFLEARRCKTLHMSYLLNYQIYWKDLKQALSTLGVGYKEWATHDFRRSFAREVWNNTKDPIIMKEMLNHVQFETTLRYLRGSGLQTKEVYYGLNEKKSKGTK
jgi:integrase